MHPRRFLSFHTRFWLWWSWTSPRCFSKLQKWKHENKLFDRTKEDFASRSSQSWKSDSPRHPIVHQPTQCKNYGRKSISSDVLNGNTPPSNGWTANGIESFGCILKFGRSKSINVTSSRFVKSELTNGLDGNRRNKTRYESLSSWTSPIRSYAHLVK